MIKTVTNGSITKGKGIFAVMALALGMLFLLACSNQPASEEGGAEGRSTPNQTRIGAELAGLLSGQGSPAFRAGFAGVQNGNPGVWVSGTGKASAAPDLAILNMGVEALADTVGEARSRAAEAMAATIAALQEQGVAIEDIQTRTFNISPRYTRREVTRCPSETEGISPSTTSTQETITLQDARGGHLCSARRAGDGIDLSQTGMLRGTRTGAHGVPGNQPVDREGA